MPRRMLGPVSNPASVQLNHHSGNPFDATDPTWIMPLLCQDMLFTDTFQATVRNLVRHKKPVAYLN